MDGRSYTLGGAKEHRYGFNGKEKDEDGEWGNLTHYDYGFRIYNPAIAKFLSVDPLTKSYPFLTPYQFAQNTPIQAIDRDGAEAEVVVTKIWNAAPTLKFTDEGEVWERNYFTTSQTIAYDQVGFDKYAIDGAVRSGTLHVMEFEEDPTRHLNLYFKHEGDDDKRSDGYALTASWGHSEGARISSNDLFPILDVEAFSHLFGALSVTYKIPNPFVKAANTTTGSLLSRTLGKASKFYNGNFVAAPTKFVGNAGNSGITFTKFEEIAINAGIYGRTILNTADKVTGDLLHTDLYINFEYLNHPPTDNNKYDTLFQSNGDTLIFNKGDKPHGVPPGAEIWLENENK